MVNKSTPRQANIGGPKSIARNYLSRFDAWLLRRLYSSIGNPQIRITMGDSLRSRQRLPFLSPPS